ncbi:hypothetical protein [Geobacter sp. SVR]|uniref:hypothetical protein n=1 Tax=Geobacter sp. SVR TaxID=2495594 RepID=UPI00143F01D8|nr:hypothetical protein [Geobacter sp. SVR]BCS54561.1 hypothetical protein GSVR_28690 [Geobacter sp. SVR]GCF86932.1 hypothetical protein GSbR_35320 [Geobacter sp. SVR]
MAVNGNLYDWESIEVQLPSGICIGITNIDYDDERPIEERYGKGNVPRGFGRKNYKASAKMELDLDEAERLRMALGGSLYDGLPFPIVVSYASEGLPIVTDILPACKITKTSTGGKQGDDNVGARKLDLKVLAPIQWGGASAL